MIAAKHLLLLIFILINALSSGIDEDHTFTYKKARYNENHGWEMVPSILNRIRQPVFPADTFNLMDFGGRGDSLHDNHPAFQKAILACHQNGGGTVLIPPGNYFIKGPIRFLSNINLHVSEGSRIYFSDDAAHYLPAVKVRWEGTVCYNYSPLIYGYQLENIAITGGGVIDGNAKSWSMNWRALQDPDKRILRKMGDDTVPEYKRVFGNGFLDLDNDGNDDGYGDGKNHFLRPTLIELYECKNILIENLTLQNSPFWTLHPVFSKNITIRNLTIYGSTLNDDGVDPDSCEDVLIEDCRIKTHDDAISIKAGRDQDAWHRTGSRHIIIRNNELLSGVNALCIGSEMSGGVKYVFAENNIVQNGKHAINFKCNLDRGGFVRNVYIRQFDIRSCEEAMLIFRMDYHGYRGNNYPTRFNDFYISNIQCENVMKRPFQVIGVPERPVKKILLHNITVNNASKENRFEYVEDIILDDIQINDKRIKQTKISRN